MRRRKQINSLKLYFIGLFAIIFLIFVVATSNSKRSIVINNLNTIKAVSSSRIKAVDEKIISVNSVQEIINNKNKKLEFTGTLTGYGADCVGCSGKVGCYPNQDIRNGNIYYDDKDYGKLRILASDPSIPCGSIIKVSNFGDDFYGIVLDRGSLVKGLTMDLLFENENQTRSIGRLNNINFKIERWGFYSK